MKHRILVFEENQANGDLLCHWLEAQGFAVVSASSLQAAFSALNHQAPDAVLLDVQFGQEDGLILARRLRRDPAVQHIPIIAVTAHTLLTEQERVIRAGCHACVSVPLDFAVLSSLLDQWLIVSAVLQGRTERELQPQFRT